ncbi:54S ribosomal protein l4 [Mycena venus]|uniref:Large ribosomal subunit protein uL29m n=1 Tax=Mycena venus TaxID=2733690 RepID=A0A8H6YS12_9AGAR|nr:54S ribosomal protein l4 [Mycena venus]
MHLPEELISLVLAKVYYEKPTRLSGPDYVTLSACSLINSYWRNPAQVLLFRTVTKDKAAAFSRSADTMSNHALLSHVRTISVSLTKTDSGAPPTQGLVGIQACSVGTLASILGHCPHLYELCISAHRLFSLDAEDLSTISTVIHVTSIVIRSLRLIECSVQSPLLYELIGLFPSVEFLTVGVEIAAAPPPWTPAIQLYELTLQRTSPSDVLQWLLSSSRTSLRILELRDLPSASTHTDIAMCSPHIQSLRLMRYNAYSAAILRQCTNLLELVLLNIPTSLPALPPSLEHFALLIQTYTASVDLRPVIEAIEELPHLRLLTFVGDPPDILQATCDAKGVTLQASLRKFWILGAPADHRPNTSYDAGSSSTPLAIGSEGSTAEINPNSSTFVPPSAAQLSSDHGLYAFFRRKDDPNLRGDDRYETFTDPTIKYTGRSWLASELRLKSFKDLHTLWYVLLRERNMLATQREEMRRMGLARERFPDANKVNSAKCRKTMARIKGIMNERRLAYEGAITLAEKDREAAEDAKVLKFKVDQYTTEKHRQHTEQLRQRLIVKPVRTQRAGLKVRERRNQAGESLPEKAKQAISVDGEKIKKAPVDQGAKDSKRAAQEAASRGDTQKPRKHPPSFTCSITIISLDLDRKYNYWSNVRFCRCLWSHRRISAETWQSLTDSASYAVIWRPPTRKRCSMALTSRGNTLIAFLRKV